MDNYYFPLFLVAVGVIVLWMFRRAGSRDKRSTRRHTARTPAGRTAGGGSNLHRNTDRIGPAARSATSKPKDIWQTKRHHLDKESFVERTARTGVYHAGYFNAFDETERRAYARHELKDQNITEAEHLGIDEYLTKREAERAAAEAEKAGGLSMTAMKYEPADASDEAKEERKKQASFKP